MKLTDEMLLAGGLLVAGLVAAWYVKNNAVDLAAGLVTGAAGIVTDVGAGVVMGAGDILGVPRTNETECDKALREGRTWDASFACPAGTFIRGIFD